MLGGRFMKGMNRWQDVCLLLRGITRIQLFARHQSLDSSSDGEFSWGYFFRMTPHECIHRARGTRDGSPCVWQRLCQPGAASLPCRPSQISLCSAGLCPPSAKSTWTSVLVRER